MQHLFRPLTIRSVSLPNRLVLSPMCQYSSEDGFANDWHLVHLGSRAVGGTGLIFTEATAVSPAGRITPGDLGIYKDEHILPLKRITRFIKAQGAVAGIQLAHAGRKASHQSPWEGGRPLRTEEGAWTTEAPSAIPYKEGDPLPHSLSEEELKSIVKDFTAAALRAKEAGFEVIELHAAHGYLLHEFLSPLSNTRTDGWGGILENRARLLLQITDSVRAAIGDDLPLFVRISATDWVPGGWTIDESVALAKLLSTHGVDCIDCSSGGASPLQQIPVGSLYQVPFAERIKRESGMMTGAVGLITTAEEGEEILATEKADLIFIGRQLLREPYFALRAGDNAGTDLKWPVQYERAKKR